MTTWRSGMMVTGGRLNTRTADRSTTSGLVAATDWSVQSFEAYSVGGIVYVTCLVQRTGADITATGGNIADTLMCTLPGDWAPAEVVNAQWGNGFADGECTINPDGTVSLRSANGTIGGSGGGNGTNTNVRFTASWVSEDVAAGPATPSTPAGGGTMDGWFVPTGLVGDGTSDDTTAIQDALDAAYTAGGGIVLIPGGRTYAVSTFLVVRANTTIWAYGATIKSIHATTGCLRNFYGTDDVSGYGGHSRIRVYGGVWDGNAHKAADSTGVVTATTNIATFLKCSDIVVRDAVFRDTSSAHGLELNAVSGALVSGCRFEGFIDNSGDGSRATSEFVEIDLAKSGDSAIPEYDGTACTDIVFEGCWFGPSVRLASAGRAIGSHGAVTGSYYDRITVRDCTILGTSADVGIRAMYWRDSVIANNKISGTAGAGILAVTDATVTQACNSLTIEGNLVENSGSDAGIWVDGVSAAQWTDVVVRGNIVRSPTGYGVRADYAPGVVIQGNRTYSTSTGGILAQESVRAQITGNSVSSAGSNGINAAGSAGVNITGNLVDTTTSNHGITVGASTSAGGNATITGNTLRSVANAGIRLTAPGCTAIGNKVFKDGGSTANGISLSSGATGCTLLANDLGGNSWDTGTALSVSTAAPVVTSKGGTILPGSNIVSAMASGATLATVANTTTRTALATATVPAGDAVAGAAYRLRVYGTASVTGTPTLAIGLNIGSTTVATCAAVTAGSGVSGKGWIAEAVVHCVTTGTSGTWSGGLTVAQQYGTASTLSGLVDGTVTASTAAAATVSVTATWGTANAANTATATAATFERIG